MITILHNCGITEEYTSKEFNKIINNRLIAGLTIGFGCSALIIYFLWPVLKAITCSTH